LLRDWEEKLNAFLQFNDFEVLQNKGKISREVARVLAEKEYEVYRSKQDREYVSDFDMIVRKLKEPDIKKDDTK